MQKGARVIIELKKDIRPNFFYKKLKRKNSILGDFIYNDLDLILVSNESA